jgi:oxygen-independent coproporphyrinogen-3 oxidase
VAYAGKDSFMGAYHTALTQEIKAFAAQGKHSATIETIFLGGGTPSTYPDNLLLDTSGILRSAFTISDTAEFTIEVNPGTVRVEQFAPWKEAGINRLSIGVQSLNDKVLNNLNRRQSATDVTQLLERAQHHFNNISIDLIIGLPGVSAEEWKQLIQTVCTWPIVHLSVYFLTIHEGTALYFRVKKNDVTLPADEAIVDLYLWTREYLTAYGFEQYEISNFAKPGFRSQHNQVYWAQKPYKGFGVGACSFDGTSRFQNNKDLFKYMKAIEQGGDILELEEILTPEQQILETIMLGLRQARGIERERLFKQGNEQWRQEISATLDDLVSIGYVEQNDGYIRLTPAGLAVENEIIVRLSR